MGTLDNENAVLHMEGVFAHVAMPYSGVNVTLYLLNFTGCTYGDKFAHGTYTMLKNWQGKPLGTGIDGVCMGFLAVSAGIVNIGHNEASVVVDVRYPNDAGPKHVMKGFADTTKKFDYVLGVTLKKDIKPPSVDPDSKLVQTLNGVYRDYAHGTFTPSMMIDGGTYAKKLDNFVAFGPRSLNKEQPKDVFIGSYHQKDEVMRVEDSLRAVAICTVAIKQLVK